MASRVSICNMALAHVGAAARIQNLDTENSVAAEQCRAFYDHDVELVLRGFDWPFATGYSVLSLVAEDPSDDWAYAYRYPNTALKIRRIVTTLGRQEFEPPPFVVGQDSQGPLIYTAQQDAKVETTVKVTDPGRFDPLFVEALSWKLASDIAPALARVKGAQENAFKIFAHWLATGQIIVANEQQRTPALDSEFIRARG